MHCPACGHATHQGDRFCAKCGTEQEQRCSTCGTALPDGAHFCPSCGTAVGSATEVDSSAGAEERKVVSVVFADLVGFTAASDGEDPEDVRSRLRPYHQALRDDVERFGGRIEKLLGDGVLAVFGAPVAHEDDPERAIRAGLRIQESIANLAAGSQLKARVAVGTGEAVVALEGTTMDREGLVGDVVNTVSRLQGEAEPGSVLVDEATYRATRRAFNFDAMAPVEVKGKAEPLQVWVAREPISRYGVDVEDDGTTFVGRTSELTLVTDALEHCFAEGSSQVVTIGGEPGVGKSRLVRELRRHIDELPDLIRWRQGRCLPYGEGITFWALSEIVKAEAGILETDPPGTALGKLGDSLEGLLPDEAERHWVAGRLAPLIGSEHDARADRTELFAAWRRYVVALSEQRPSVLVVEDLHWADSALIDFLEELPEATRDSSLLLVATARPEFFEAHPTWGSGQRNAVTVRLEPLHADETLSLIDELLADHDISAEARSAVADRTGGNPLWAQEFVRMLRDDPGAVDTLPDSVQAIVAARLDLLDAGTKSAILAAATVGKNFWHAAAAAALGPDGPDDLDTIMRELVRRELIRRERTSTVAGEVEYSFTHSVIRDVAYKQVPRGTRAERHHRVGRWIEEMARDRLGDRAEVLAFHDSEALRLAVADGADDVGPLVEAAIASHYRAARTAERIDLATASAHLEAALGLMTPDDNRRPRVLHRLGKISIDTGELDSGEKTLLEARAGYEILGDIEGLGTAIVHIGRIRWARGDTQASAETFREAIDTLRAHPPGPALALALAQNAVTLWLRGAMEETLAAAEEARVIVETHGNARIRGRLMSADGGARFDMGDPSAIEAFRQALRIAVESDHTLGIVSTHINLGEQLNSGWGTEEAITVTNRAIEVAVQRSASAGETMARGNLANFFIDMCRFDDALEELTLVEEKSGSLPYAATLGRGLGARIAAARGDLDDAVSSVEALIPQALAIEDLQLVIPAYANAAWVHLLAGNTDEAVAAVTDILERAGASRYLVDTLSIVTEVLHRAGQIEMLEPLLEDLRRFRMPRPEAHLALVDALSLEPEQAQEALDAVAAATDALVELGVPLWAAFAQSAAVRIAESAGDDSRASAARHRIAELLAPAKAERLVAVLLGQ